VRVQKIKLHTHYNNNNYWTRKNAFSAASPERVGIYNNKNDGTTMAERRRRSAAIILFDKQTHTHTRATIKFNII